MRVTTGTLLGPRALAVLLSLTCLAPLPPVAAQGARDISADAVKAAYLYQFAAYVEWPANRLEEPDSPFVIGVMGMDILGEELIEIARGRSVDGRSVDVRLLSEEDPLTGLHILFIAEDVPRAAEVSEAAQSASVLVVADSGRPSAENAVINFRIVDNRVRFEVFLDEAELSGLKLSSRLLAVALEVHGTSAP